LESEGMFGRRAFGDGPQALDDEVREALVGLVL